MKGGSDVAFFCNLLIPMNYVIIKKLPITKISVFFAPLNKNYRNI